jgi:hypothetical protein
VKIEQKKKKKKKKMVSSTERVGKKLPQGWFHFSFRIRFLNNPTAPPKEKPKIKKSLRRKKKWVAHKKKFVGLAWKGSG